MKCDNVKQNMENVASVKQRELRRELGQTFHTTLRQSLVLQTS